MPIKHILALATFAFASTVTSVAFAHAKLQSSDPQAGSTLGDAPKQVRLKFNEALEPAFSKIKVMGPQNNEIPVTATTVDKADPTVMTAPLPPLSSGEYHIQWSTMTHDGHKAKGEVTFKVK
ncbi:copper homeostasis periplasmic binding protein CopC [Massilia norwichensis]|jgi:methionine-rich copper-binding protein CopC|uniref:Copper homeostasis periplasmic binding protein CopC n=1 Tax=Massilia norwichensis TaxID=1442366 RepID=A0ABT2A2B3_9BURK|nr:MULTISPECIES: copper homeostasis periplasmic binding protein CopC [Massilia]MCS0588336.1 copper homeostasis periplasmic binding protein CopC [Massilia norwichensis]MDN4054280.1 copper homeostasis periplasmic binding protein CopC [Massilia sp. YIM B02763]